MDRALGEASSGARRHLRGPTVRPAAVGGTAFVFCGELDRLAPGPYHCSSSQRGRACPHRLVAQDIWFSARKPGFDSPWGYLLETCPEWDEARSLSSAGRALRSHRRGRWFESSSDHGAVFLPRPFPWVAGFEAPGRSAAVEWVRDRRAAQPLRNETPPCREPRACRARGSRAPGSGSASAIRAPSLQAEGSACC